jgi:hypothetical protein
MPVRVDESELWEIARKAAEAVKQAVRLTAVELTEGYSREQPSGSWKIVWFMEHESYWSFEL